MVVEAVAESESEPIRPEHTHCDRYGHELTDEELGHGSQREHQKEHGQHNECVDEHPPVVFENVGCQVWP